MTLQPIGQISIGVLVHALVLIFTLPRILKIKRDATAAIAWICGVLLLPYIGAVLFWTMGDPEMRRPLRRVIRGPAIFRSRSGRSQDSRFPELHNLMERLGETTETVGNRVRFYVSGRRLFRALARDLERAHHEICVQYYILRDDAVGRPLVDLLKRKAAAGLKVRVLYDAMGSHGLKRPFLRELRRAGVLVHPFLPVSILRRRVQINFRNHRKLVIVDRRVAYTGGFNVGREYAGLSSEYWSRNWYDAHCRIEGPAVEHLAGEFGADWAFAAENETQELEAEPRWLDEPGQRSRTRAPGGCVLTVSGGPDQDTNRIRTLMFWAFTRARKRLWIASPYFVPDQSILDTLSTAVLAGVDVRILTQNNRPDKMLPYWAAAYFAIPLIEAGVKVFQYEPGMMHAKMFLVDDRLASIGSANVDVRSLSLNFELNCVFGSPKEIRAVERLFENAFDDSWVVTPEMLARRTLTQRLLANFSRLFAPAL